MSFVDLDDWDARGITCVVCKASDADADPMIPGKKRMWGYPPVLSKKTQRYTTQGRGCLLCTKVAMAWYYPRIKLTEMADRMGADVELHQETLCLDDGSLGIMSLLFR